MRCFFKVTLLAALVLFRALPAGAEPNDWQNLLKEKEALFSLAPPPNFSQEQFNEFLRKFGDQAGALAERMEDFYRGDPNGALAEEAWDEWMGILQAGVGVDRSRLPEIERVESEFLANPELSVERRARIRRHQVERAGDLKTMERLLRQANQELQGRGGALDYRYMMLNIASASDPANARRILDEILPGAQGFYREKAIKLDARLKLLEMPLELKFTGLDGEQYDLRDYRGKVVLLDFWATWCPPCIAGIPRVKTAFEKYRTEGFEVIGISYDSDRSTLERYLAGTPLPWPQFFDAEGRDSSLALSLGQPGPPAYWLIDREGKVSDLNGFQELETKIEKLLAANAAE